LEDHTSLVFDDLSGADGKLQSKLRSSDSFSDDTATFLTFLTSGIGSFQKYTNQRWSSLCRRKKKNTVEKSQTAALGCRSRAAGTYRRESTHNRVEFRRHRLHRLRLRDGEAVARSRGTTQVCLD
jgi:hypothetical protein